MGFRRRTRRRALIAGAVAGGAIAHHERKKYADEEQPAYDQAPADDYQEQAQSAPAPADQGQYAPPPADPADEVEHLAQLHSSGVLTDEEFAAAKAKIIGS
jgi:hypothetical protein